MTVAEYMQACLHDPEDGYYATRPSLGAEGDFITAPHVSQTFGELLGAWAAEIWAGLGQPARVRLVELGPGDGTMMVDVLRTARAAPGFFQAIDLVLLETSAPLRRRQAERLSARWISRIDEIGEDAPIIILANEFLDCLPIRQAVRRSDGWRERRVGVDAAGALVFVDGEPCREISTASPTRRLVEWSPALERFGAQIGGLIGRAGGAGIFIDYGGDGAGDTLQALQSHRKEGPLDNPGDADLTARVDFRAFLAAAGDARAYGPVAQGPFLRAIGIKARAAALAKANPAQAAKIARQVERLIGPDQMGELFQAACLASPGLAPPGFP
ncbi:MAG TPA: SAM-dependent methyltransferase [Caulobacteraceae bacterium]